METVWESSACWELTCGPSSGGAEQRDEAEAEGTAKCHGPLVGWAPAWLTHAPHSYWGGGDVTLAAAAPVTGTRAHGQLTYTDAVPLRPPPHALRHSAPHPK